MIIPSIDIQNGRAVQLVQGKKFVLDGGDPIDRAEEFSLVGEVAVIDLDAAMGSGSNRDLIKEMCRIAQVRVGGGIRTVQAAQEWLDAGASKIMLGTAATVEVCSQLPRDRIIAAVDSVAGEVVVEGWKKKTGELVQDRMDRLAQFVGGFLLTQVEYEGGMQGFDLDLPLRARSSYPELSITYAGGIRTANEIADLDAYRIDTQVGMALYSCKVSLAECLSGCLRKPTDNRFWPTVVEDESGKSLGLVWSTVESIEQAVRKRKGIYWSRSRNELWEKGSTSGNTQSLRRVNLDCDRDALRFVVKQEGPFCHTGSQSCWNNSFSLTDLEHTLCLRKKQPFLESGTARLLADGDLLAMKIREEAAELIEAQSNNELVHEASDLLYFMMVKLVAEDVPFQSIVNELERRSRRVTRRLMVGKNERAAL